MEKSIFVILLLALSGWPICAADHIFTPPELNGLRIDKCVAGEGWGNPNNLFNPLNGERCSLDSQRNIADKFCQDMGFTGVVIDDETAWEISMNWPEQHMIWKYARGADPAQGEWGKAYGGHHFSRIVCGGENNRNE